MEASPTSLLNKLDRLFCQVNWLGQLDYLSAWELQQRLVEERRCCRHHDTLLLLEHPPTYTLGVSGKERHLLVSRETLARQGVCIYRVDRGGDITFHGPGQLVGYPVLDLRIRNCKVVQYLRDLEEVLIRTLADYGITGYRIPRQAGVWVEDKKIAAIGVKVNSRGITSHGFALNVTSNLGYFNQIVPCGIQHKGVTSMAKAMGRPVPLTEVMERVVTAFGDVFGMHMASIT